MNEFYKKRVDYEWTVEQIDRHGDSQNSDHIAFKDWPVENDKDCTATLVLKRYMGSDADGVLDIGYAYLNDGKLEAEFSCGHTVPARFIKQAESLIS